MANQLQIQGRNAGQATPSATLSGTIFRREYRGGLCLDRKV